MIETNLKKYERLLRRLHKSDGHVQFLTECSKGSLLPNFTYIAASTVSQLNLKKNEISRYRIRQLDEKLAEQLENNYEIKYELNFTFSILSTLIHHSILKGHINNISNKVKFLEKKNDKRRQRKLELLKKNSKIPNLNTQDYAKAKIINFTRNNVEILVKIKQMLELGIKHPIGGISDKTQILHKNEILFSHWLNFAQKTKISNFKIAEIRALLTLEMQKL